MQQSHLITTWYLFYGDWFDICDIFLFDIFRNKQNRQKMEKKPWGILDHFIYNIFKKPNETPNKKKM